MSLRDECTNPDCRHAKESHHEVVTTRPTGPYGLPKPVFARLACLALHCECSLYTWQPPENDDA